MYIQPANPFPLRQKNVLFDCSHQQNIWIKMGKKNN